MQNDDDDCNDTLDSRKASENGVCSVALYRTSFGQTAVTLCSILAHRGATVLVYVCVLIKHVGLSLRQANRQKQKGFSTKTQTDTHS